jgi:hypothetical protein
VAAKGIKPKPALKDAPLPIPYAPNLPGKVLENASSVSVQSTLDQRGSVYGSFRDNSRVAISLLAVVDRCQASRTVPLLDHELNALIMICEKMSRILTGKPHEDNWIDIAGYAELGRNPR